MVLSVSHDLIQVMHLGGGQECYVRLVFLSDSSQKAPDVSCPLLVVVIFNHLVKVMSSRFLHLKILFFPLVIRKGNNLAGEIAHSQPNFYGLLLECVDGSYLTQ